MINEEKQKTEQLLEGLKGLGRDEKESKLEDSINLIEHYLSMTSRLDERMIKIFQFNQAYIAVLLTIIAISLKFLPKNYVNSFIISFGIMQLCTAFWCILTYLRQTNFHYVFRNSENLQPFGNQWKWFYHGNEYISKIKTPKPILMPLYYSLFKKNKTKKHNEEKYLLGLNQFLKNYKDEDIDARLSASLLQLYLLQVHNYYKNRFDGQLISILGWGFVFSLIIAIVCLSLDYFEAFSLAESIPVVS